MRNTVKIFALLSVIGIAMSIGAMAGRSDIMTPSLPPSEEGAMYDKRDLWPAPSDGVQVPNSVRATNSGTVSSRPGPLAASGEKFNFVAGSALVSPRGGMVSTPQMRADREIGRLIRKLD